MDYEKFKHAQSLNTRIKNVESNLSRINDMFFDKKKVILSNGKGGTFDVSDAVELEIRVLIRKSYMDELDKLRAEFEGL